MSFREEEKVYRISDLLEARKFSSMQLLCGEKGKGREIKGIRIIEVEDMDRFLSGEKFNNKFACLFKMYR